MIDQSTYRSVMKAEIRRAPKVLPSEGTCSEDGKGGAATAWIDVVSIIGVVVHCDRRIYNASSSFSGEVGCASPRTAPSTRYYYACIVRWYAEQRREIVDRLRRALSSLKYNRISPAFLPHSRVVNTTI